MTIKDGSNSYKKYSNNSLQTCYPNLNESFVDIVEVEPHDFNSDKPYSFEVIKIELLDFVESNSSTSVPNITSISLYHLF